MTGKERLISAANRQSVDRQPKIGWLGARLQDFDGVICQVAELQSVRKQLPDKALLAEIMSPFGRSCHKNANLTKTLHDDPELGQRLLCSFKDEVLSEIEIALANGADGVLYRLAGAHPKANSPMEYGGHYLEVDRQILDIASTAKINVLLIEGEQEVYFDFVSDLPAQFVSWRPGAEPCAIHEVRKTHSVALDDELADVRLIWGQEVTEQSFEQLKVASR